MTADPVLFDSIPCGGYSIGIATLNNPSRLNSLDIRMIELLHRQLDEWAANERVALVVLQGTGDRAFCAGGDSRNITDAIAAGDLAVAQRYFAAEYRLDHLIHTFPKPILAWCHGVIMGGGLGLMQGASHRVVTDSAVLAMPEIGIGLFPDVGAAWFMQRMPGRLGLFCGLTGARLGPLDATRCGLADYRMSDEDHANLFGLLTRLPLGPDPVRNHEAVSRLLQDFRTKGGTSGFLDRIESINAVTDHRAPLPLRDALAAAAQDDEWYLPCAERVAAGSPTTFALVLEQFRRCRHLSLREVLQLDLVIAMRCCQQSDFPEGVRALLIDKDGNPRWSPRRLEEVEPATVEQYFLPPWTGEHPLADLAGSMQ